MAQQTYCPECGAEWADGKTCQDDFNQMLAWEFGQPELWEAHHLTVLSYYLQHPSLYSAEGLNNGKWLLIEFVQNGLAPEEMRTRNRDKVDAGKRAWKLRATGDAHGAYANPVEWPITAAQVVTGGTSGYCDNVRAWAESVYAALESSGNLA